MACDKQATRRRQPYEKSLENHLSKYATFESNRGQYPRKGNKLDSFLSDGIVSCRVTVEAPHRHHHKGKAYKLRIGVTVPGGELVINREPKRLVASRAGHGEERQKSWSRIMSRPRMRRTKTSTSPSAMLLMPQPVNCRIMQGGGAAKLRPTNPSQRARCENFPH